MPCIFLNPTNPDFLYLAGDAAEGNQIPKSFVTKFS